MQADFTLNNINQIAKQLLEKVPSGGVITLSGELAAGKTTLTQAILKELNYPGRVNSPTFVIEHRYPVKTKDINEVLHLDFYRLDEEQLKHFDWQEYLLPNRLVIIEWPEKALNYLPKETIQVKLEKIDDKTRRIHY